MLAGYIVARVSGQPYEQYIQDHIFNPLGMVHSTTQQPIPPGLRGAADQRDCEERRREPGARVGKPECHRCCEQDNGNFHCEVGAHGLGHIWPGVDCIL